MLDKEITSVVPIWYQKGTNFTKSYEKIIKDLKYGKTANSEKIRICYNS